MFRPLSVTTYQRTVGANSSSSQISNMAHVGAYIFYEGAFLWLSGQWRRFHDMTVLHAVFVGIRHTGNRFFHQYCLRWIHHCSSRVLSLHSLALWHHCRLITFHQAGIRCQKTNFLFAPCPEQAYSKDLAAKGLSSCSGFYYLILFFRSGLSSILIFQLSPIFAIFSWHWTEFFEQFLAMWRRIAFLKNAFVIGK